MCKDCPQILVKTKFGTDLSTLKDIEGFDESTFDVDEFDQDCERIVGMAMESYVRAEYGNLWETHQLRPHAFGHTWSPGYVSNKHRRKYGTLHPLYIYDQSNIFKLF